MNKELDELLVNNMTEDGYKFWKSLEEKIPPIWDRLSSSTKKYHKKENGDVQTILDHTYEMVYACCNIMRLFNIVPKTKDADTLILAILLHDAFKYGVDDPLHSKHTSKNHDRIIGNTIVTNKNLFLKILNENQIYKLEQMTRYHSGRWSTDADPSFTFRTMNPETFFVHMLDMLSANNCLKVPIKNIKKEEDVNK